MPKEKVSYSIDDAKSVDHSLGEFATKLAEVDPSLAAVLSPFLLALSNGDTVDQDQLRTNLFNATAPKKTEDGERSEASK